MTNVKNVLENTKNTTIKINIMIQIGHNSGKKENKISKPQPSISSSVETLQKATKLRKHVKK